jgi:hypothetical protein
MLRNQIRSYSSLRRRKRKDRIRYTMGRMYSNNHNSNNKDRQTDEQTARGGKKSGIEINSKTTAYCPS